MPEVSLSLDFFYFPPRAPHLLLLSIADLFTIGGYHVVIAYLKSRHSSLKWRAAEIVGTVVQNDAGAQQKGLEAGTLPLLREAFESGDDQVRKKVIYAISGLVRHHPAATAAFLQSDGLELIRRGMDDSFVDVQLKTVFLLLNLMLVATLPHSFLPRGGLTPCSLFVLVGMTTTC